MSPKTGNVTRLNSVTELLEIAGKLKASTVVVPGGDRVEDLRLVESARDHGIVDRIILVGKKEGINRAIREVGIEIRPRDVVSASGDERVAAATVELIKAGGVDIVLKGNISTPVMNRHIRPLAVRNTVSLVTVFDAPPIAFGRPMILTDAGFTTVCNFGRMVDLVRNAVDVARVVMGIRKPRVAKSRCRRCPPPGWARNSPRENGRRRSFTVPFPLIWPPTQNQWRSKGCPITPGPLRWPVGRMSWSVRE